MLQCFVNNSHTTPKYHYHSGYENVEIDEEGVVKLSMRANNSNFQEVSFQVSIGYDFLAVTNLSTA